MAMGASKTPHEDERLDDAQVLRPARESFVVVLWHEKRDRFRPGNGLALSRCVCAHSETHQGSEGRASLRPCVEGVLCAANSGLHPCPLRFDRSVLERSGFRSRCLGSAVASLLVSFPRLVRQAFERLEPCEGKLSRTVLRGLGGSNPARLLDRGWGKFGAKPAQSETTVRAAAQRRS